MNCAGALNFVVNVGKRAGVGDDVVGAVRQDYLTVAVKRGGGGESERRRVRARIEVDDAGIVNGIANIKC